MKLEQKIRELVPGIEEIPEDLPLPVRYDGMSFYWGPNNEMVADFDEEVNMKEYPTDTEIHHRWCEDCENKYKGVRQCPNCEGINTGIDEPIIRLPKRRS